MPIQSLDRAHLGFHPLETTEATRSVYQGCWALDEIPAASLGQQVFELRPGERIGWFEIVGPLGRGGMGEVYVATDERLGRRVALKLLPRGFHGEAARLRLQHEARAASSLNHPNILTVYEVGECAGRAFIATELIDGITLRKQLQLKRLETSEILDIAIQTASALSAAHAAGIVHRDIKPANIMIRPDGYVKVLDFGLAKMPVIAGAGLNLLSIDRTEAGSVVGSVPYMSPEQAQAKPLDNRSDIFSFGAVLYEMVCGERPFAGTSRTSTLRAVIHGTPATISAAPNHPSDLEAVISRCLEKDVDRRFQSIDDVKQDLEKIREQMDPRRQKRLLIAALILMIAVVAGAVCGFLGPAHRRVAPVRAVPFTTLPGGEYEPAFSPDGSRIAFVWNGERKDNFDVYVKAVGSEVLTRLTHDPAGEGSPTWSPDGRTIAFLRYRGEPGRSTIYTVPAQGGPEQKIAQVFPREHIFDRQLDWSPDGRTLAIVDKQAAIQPFGIFVLDSQTGRERKLTHPPLAIQGDSGPAFSPDGTLVAFCRTVRTGVRSLYVVALKDGLEKELPFVSTSLSSHAWSADGKSLIVAAEREGLRGLWRQPVSGGLPEPIAPAKANFISVSKAGNRIAYSQWFADTNIWRMPIGKDGSLQEQSQAIIASTLEDRSPQYSPDGTRIAFRSDRSGSKEIWMSDAEGHNATQLTSFNGPLTGSPRWSPDGAAIVFDSRPAGQSGIFTVRVDNRKVTRITNGSAEDAVPYWSHDGRWIYYASTRSGTWQIWKIPVNGADRDARSITTEGGFAPQESPNGKFVYYAKSRDERPGLWRVPADGGREEQVIAELKPGYWGYWAIQRDAIQFLDPDGNGHASMNRFALASGKIQRHLGVFPDPPFGDSGISVSPDGKALLYTQVDRSGSEIWLVDNVR